MNSNISVDQRDNIIHPRDDNTLFIVKAVSASGAAAVILPSYTPTASFWWLRPRTLRKALKCGLDPVRPGRGTSAYSIWRFDPVRPRGNNHFRGRRRRRRRPFVPREPLDHDGKPIKETERIHLLGGGAMGLFIAHSLKSVTNPPPLTLIFRNHALFKKFVAGPREISVTTKDLKDSQKGIFPEHCPRSRPNEREESDVGGENSPQDALSSIEEKLSDVDKVPRAKSKIYNLIVSVKAPSVLNALRRVRDRLTPESTILFLQQGLGIADEVSEQLFPDADTRPNFIAGVFTHTITPISQFHVRHDGTGTIALGLLPRRPFISMDADPEQQFVRWDGTSRYLMRTLTRVPALAALGLGPTELFLLQLEKLAVNAVIQPLTVMLDCRYGSLLYNFHITRVQRLLIAEISLVICSLPELRGMPNVNTRFSPDRLEGLVVGVLAKTAENFSSMLMDSRRGVHTEIEYVNGYIVRRGEELGIKCVMNYMMVQLVNGKTWMISQEKTEYLPLLGEATM